MSTPSTPSAPKVINHHVDHATATRSNVDVSITEIPSPADSATHNFVPSALHSTPSTPAAGSLWSTAPGPKKSVATRPFETHHPTRTPACARCPRPHHRTRATATPVPPTPPAPQPPKPPPLGQHPSPPAHRRRMPNLPALNPGLSPGHTVGVHGFGGRRAAQLGVAARIRCRSGRARSRSADPGG